MAMNSLYRKLYLNLQAFLYIMINVMVIVQCLKACCGFLILLKLFYVLILLYTPILYNSSVSYMYTYLPKSKVKYVVGSKFYRQLSPCR